MVDEQTIRRTHGRWQRFTGTKWTFISFHLVLVLSYCCIRDVHVWGTLVVWFVMQFGIHAGYHRYFAHRSFRTHPWFELILGGAGCLAFQNGPLWWASKHRRHHQCADTEHDLHSPIKGFWQSHIGWLWEQKVGEVDWRLIRDLFRPVPVWIEYHQAWIHGSYISLVFLAGRWEGLLYWWVTPIVLCWHTTFATNSICHMAGSQPFRCRPQASCNARNNLLVAIANLGEGWHNNHHAHPSICHHGFYRWFQLDIVFCVLLILERLGIVWELRRKRCTRASTVYSR